MRVVLGAWHGAATVLHWDESGWRLVPLAAVMMDARAINAQPASRFSVDSTVSFDIICIQD